MKDHKLTEKQALRARDWAMKHLGLDGWRVELWWQSDIPDWAVRSDGKQTDGGCFSMATQYRSADIWVNLKICDADPDFDRLSCLMHEMVHVGHNACDFKTGFCRAGEFLTDRFADIMAYAYRHKMKPWRAC